MTKLTTRKSDWLQVPFDLVHSMCILFFSLNMRARLFLIVGLISSALLWLFLLIRFAPVSEEIRSALRFPSSFHDLRELADTLNLVQKENLSYLLVLFSSAYLFKQAFAVPGSVFMNVLAGAVFGIGVGFPLCSLLTGSGATCCYLLARLCGRDAVVHYFPERVESFKTKLKANKDSLAYFLLALRLLPVSPNWAINICCGVLNVPMSTFFWTATVGLMPYNFVCIQAGALLSDIKSMDDVYNASTLLKLSLVAVLALVPALIKSRKSRVVQ